MPREEINFSDMTVEELQDKIEGLRAELFNLRFRNTMRQLDNPLTIRYARRDLARCMTALTEHTLGKRLLAGDHK